MKVLIVDDNEENLYMMESLLKGSGYKVVSAKNGIKAIKKLKEHKIGMIISDIMMPKMDGFQLCRECKESEKLKNIPFIFYSATYSDEKDKEFAMNLGADRFLVSPMEPEKLLKNIKEIQKKKPCKPAKNLLKEKENYLSEYSNRLLNKLNEKVRDLEKEITHRRKVEEALVMARDAAESASRLKSEFLANMSHEIRTPMNSVLGMLDLLSETSLTNEQSEYLNTSVRAGENLIHIIDEIIDLSKIESGNLDLEKINFHLKEILLEQVETFKEMAKNKTIQLTSDINKNVPDIICGDPMHLIQIINNLLGNAIKFTDKGEVLLGVKAEESSQSFDKCTLLFSVKDSGIGIPAEIQEIIFESFRQADSSTTRKYGGSGLGLTISKKLVEKMGGRMWVESEVGKGSTFYFTALFDIGQRVDTFDSSPESIREECTSLSGRKLSILLVEDAEDNRLLIQCFLKNSHYNVDIAENGEIAVEKFKACDYDLVLMDMEMPVMDGYTATKDIRDWETEKRRNATPIVALTAHALKEDEKKSIDAGCNAHITKPIKKQKLMEAIYKYTYEYANEP